MNPNESAKTIPTMRTFAADLSAKRATLPNNHTPLETPVTPTSQVTPATGVIPPFHTFANSHKTTTPPVLVNEETMPAMAPNAQAQKIISQNSARSKTTTESLPAVVITDTKRKRFSLSQALKESVTQWWDTKKVAAKKRKMPKYTVSSAERRKGVIQKATSKTGRESTADHAAVLSRIKAAKQIPHIATQASSVIQQKTISTPTWENNNLMETTIHRPETRLVTQKIKKMEEAVTPTLTTTKVRPGSSIPILSGSTVYTPATQITIARVSEATKIAPVITTSEKLLAAAPIAPTPVEVVPGKPFIVTPVMTPARPKITPTIPMAPIVASVPNMSTPNEVVPEGTAAYPSIFESKYTDTEVTRSENSKPERRFAPPPQPKRSFIDVITQTNQLVFISFGVLLFVVVTGLGMRSYLQKTTPDQIMPVVTTQSDTAFKSSSVPPAPFLVTTPEDLFNELKKQRNATEDLFELTFIHLITNKVVRPDEFFSFVKAPVVFDFKKTASAITFGGYQGAPWIIISVLDKKTALGGMLQWESSIASNLYPILGNGIPLSQNRFGDVIISGSDVRILKNDTGEEVLVYGFINDSTIIITDTTNSFMNLATNFSTR